MNDTLAISDGSIQKALVWDAHAGIFPDPEFDFGKLSAWRDSGVDYVSLNVGFDVMDWQATFRTLAAYRHRLREFGDLVATVENTADIMKAKQDGKLAVSFDIEGANALNGDVAMVSVFYDLGVRQMLLAYNLNNEAAGGCHDVDHGLSALGRDVVREMNRVGMIVDCSHASRRTTLDMMELSSAPVVFTHSNPAALHPHGRNILDDQIKACAATGGVVGINGMGIFLGENDVSDETFADNVCYVADLVGPAHVGFGLDYKPATKAAKNLGEILRSRPDFWPASQGYHTPSIKLVSPRQLPRISNLLSKRGWSEEDLEGFLGGNFFRIAQTVWK